MAGRPCWLLGGLQGTQPGETGPPLLFTTVPFDQLLFSQPAKDPANAELPAGAGQASFWPFLCFCLAEQTEVRPQGKCSLPRSVSSLQSPFFLNPLQNPPVFSDLAERVT